MEIINVPCIIIPGLLQFYYVDNSNLTYEKLYQKYLPIFQQIHDENENNEINNEIIKKIIKEIIFVNSQQLNLFLDNNFKMIIYNQSKYLFIDEIIIGYYLKFQYPNFINNVVFISEEDLIQKFIIKEGIFSVPKNFIYFNYSVSNLLKFKMLGLWTVLLTNLFFCYDDKNLSSEFFEIIESNVNFLKNSKNEKIFSFTSFNFYQHYIYYKQIQAINSTSLSNECDSNSLEKFIELKNPIKCLLVLRTLRRNQEFKKQRFYISSENVLYQTHLGCDDISINHIHRKFDLVLTKAVEMTDMLLYSQLFKSISEHCLEQNILMVNYVPGLKYFVEKDIMGDYLSSFCNDENLKIILNKYNLKLKYPISHVVKAMDILNGSYDIKQNFTFPVIIKYKGKANFFKHRLTFLFNENSIKDYIQHLSQLEINLDGTNCVIQSFINHGGHVLKMYHLNNENHLDYRSSLPDISEEFQKNFVNNFWDFKTIELESEKYKELLQKYLNSNIDVENLINLEFLKEVSNYFEEFSKFTLFGLDFLFDHNNKEYYIVDCNSLPGYKLKLPIENKFREHFKSLMEKKNISK